MTTEMDATDKWVRDLNALARTLDEDAAPMHPSAWMETLGTNLERWKRLAAEGPQEKVTAAQFARDGLTSCLPPGTPLMGEIVMAKWAGKAKAVATLDLFDGRRGTVEVSKWAQYKDAWCIHWPELAGGAINWTGSEWERVNE